MPEQRQSNNPLKKPERPNSIFRNTEDDQTEQPEQPVIQPVQSSVPPVQQIQTPPQQQVHYSMELPGQPQTHDRRRHKVPFDQRYRKENIQVDRRILPHFYDYIASGNSRVSVINKILLKALIEAGYPLDPNLLDRPFQFEDLPK